ncbi:nucleoside-diphosphate kinase [Candidatus Gracilibacteria bacterium]|nr:nucleoside-diphosphate kinase [Candidatus Gracilibacteria bacterium]
MTEQTFTIIKPDAMHHCAEIWCIVKISGFHIKKVKKIHLTLQQAQEFYAIHKERPFFKDLTEFMSSGECMVAILEKDNAVSDFRKLIGATNPANAEAGTIRQIYGTPNSGHLNAIHGSDSLENAKIEIAILFPEN